MKNRYIFLMLGIFVVAELQGAWWHRPYQIGAHSLKYVMRVAKRNPIIVTTTILLLSILFCCKVRFKKIKFDQNIWEKAICEGDEEVVKRYLYAKIVDLERKNKCGFASIHIAAINNKPSIIEIFLDYRKKEIGGIDYYINFQDDSGKPPLTKAVEFGSKDVIRYLVLTGANVNFKSSKFDKTPFDRARKIDEENGNKEMEEFLKQKVEEKLALFS